MDSTADDSAGPSMEMHQRSEPHEEPLAESDTLFKQFHEEEPECEDVEARMPIEKTSFKSSVKVEVSV